MLTLEQLHEVIHDNNDWMQAAQGADREENPYLIIHNIPDYINGGFQGIVMYLRSERKGTDAIYACHEGDTIPWTALQRYSPKISHCFPYTPGELLTNLPEIIRDRKIVCYGRKGSVAPLRTWLASHGDRFEMPGDVVDVKEEAKRVMGLLPDYQLDTVIRALGFEPYDYAIDELGELIKIKTVYETLEKIKSVNI